MKWVQITTQPTRQKVRTQDKEIHEARTHTDTAQPVKAPSFPRPQRQGYAKEVYLQQRQHPGLSYDGFRPHQQKGGKNTYHFRYAGLQSLLLLE